MSAKCQIFDLPVVEYYYSSRDAPKQEAASSKRTRLLMMIMDTEPNVVVVSPEVEFVDHVAQIRVRPDKSTKNAGGLEAQKPEGKSHNVSEEVFVGDLIGS